jgi:hypothetical protein
MPSTLAPDPLRVRAESMRERLGAELAALGTEVSYSAGSLTVDVPARVTVLQGGVRFARFRDDEMTVWALPAFVITVAGDFLPFGAEPAAGDAVSLPGEPSGFTVRRVEKVRLAGIVIRTLLYAARNI